MNMQNLMLLGTALIILGFAIIFGAVISSSLRGGSPEADAKGGGVRGGGLIMVGPIPIAFGTDKSSVTFVMILSIIIMIIAYMLFRRQ